MLRPRVNQPVAPPGVVPVDGQQLAGQPGGVGVDDPVLLRQQVTELQQQVNLLQNPANNLNDQNQDEEDMNWLDVDDGGVDQPAGRRNRQRRELQEYPDRPADAEDGVPVTVGIDGVSTALNELLGNEANLNDGNFFIGMFIEGVTVDSKIKDKIWKGAFVELGSLAPRTDVPSRVNFNYVQGSQAQLAFTPSRVKQPANVLEWLNWFCIYSSIYTQRFATASPKMFSYVNRIFELQREEPTTFIWRHYDELFRRIKARFPKLPWQIINSQILRQAKWV